MSQLSEVVVTTVAAQEITTQSLSAGVLSTTGFANLANLTLDDAITSELYLQGAVYYGVHDVAVTSTGTPGNVFVGVTATGAPPQLTTGTKNVCIGADAGSKLTTGSSNVLLGLSAGYTSLTTQNENIALGLNALDGTTVGSQNIAIGPQALSVSVNNNNIGLGAQSLMRAGSNNIGVGVNTGVNGNVVVGDDNILLGTGAYQGATCNQTVLLGANSQTSGAFNNTVALGYGCIADQANVVFIGKDSAAPLQNFTKLILGTNLVPGSFATDVAAGTPAMPGDPAPTPLGGVYYNTDAGASVLCLRLT